MSDFVTFCINMMVEIFEKQAKLKKYAIIYFVNLYE